MKVPDYKDLPPWKISKFGDASPGGYRPERFNRLPVEVEEPEILRRDRPTPPVDKIIRKVEKGRVTKKSNPEHPEAAATAAGKSRERRHCEEHREKLLDEALEESFPASDPPSIPRTPC